MNYFKKNTKITLINRAGLIRIACLFLFLVTFLAIAIHTMFIMPGKSDRGAFSPLTTTEIAIQNSLEKYIDILANKIGIRNYQLSFLLSF